LYLIVENYKLLKDIVFNNKFTKADGKTGDSFEIFTTNTNKQIIECSVSNSDKLLFDNLKPEPIGKAKFEEMLIELGINYTYNKLEVIKEDFKVTNTKLTGNRDLREILGLTPDEYNRVACPFHPENHPSCLINSNGELLTDLHDGESYTCNKEATAILRVGANEVVKELIDNLNTDEEITKYNETDLGTANNESVARGRAEYLKDKLKIHQNMQNNYYFNDSYARYDRILINDLQTKLSIEEHKFILVKDNNAPKTDKYGNKTYRELILGLKTHLSSLKTILTYSYPELKMNHKLVFTPTKSYIINSNYELEIIQSTEEIPRTYLPVELGYKHPEYMHYGLYKFYNKYSTLAN
jgi:hypothetical protein